MFPQNWAEKEHPFRDQSWSNPDQSTLKMAIEVVEACAMLEVEVKVEAKMIETKVEIGYFPCIFLIFIPLIYTTYMQVIFRFKKQTRRIYLSFLCILFVYIYACVYTWYMCVKYMMVGCTISNIFELLK